MVIILFFPTMGIGIASMESDFLYSISGKSDM